MSLAERIPFMEAENRRRNVLVVLGVLVILSIIIQFPLVLLLIPLYLLFAIGTNHKDLRERLLDSPFRKLPGVSGEGGWKTAGAVFAYSFFVTLFVIGGLLGGAVDTDSNGLNDTTDTETPGDANGGGTDSVDKTDSDGTTESTGDEQTEEKTGTTQLFSERIDTYGLMSAVSADGSHLAFGLQDGRVLLYDQSGQTDTFQFGVERSVSHIQFPAQSTRLVVGWMDAHKFGVTSLEEGGGDVYQFPGLWSIQSTPDSSIIAATSSPTTGQGKVGVVRNDEVQWSKEFEDATGLAVAITGDGSRIAVGTGKYYSDGERQGQAAVRMYTVDGELLWRHDTPSDVLSIAVNKQQNLVVAGTDEGRLLAFDLKGNLRWQTDQGGYIALSDDGSTIIGSPGAKLVAFDAEGNKKWQTPVTGLPTSTDLSLSDDGSRVLAASMASGEVVVIEDGTVIWKRQNENGPIHGSISGDGSTWGVILQDNDGQNHRVEGYRNQT